MTGGLTGAALLKATGFVAIAPKAAAHPVVAAAR